MTFLKNYYANRLLSKLVFACISRNSSFISKMKSKYLTLTLSQPRTQTSSASFFEVNCDSNFKKYTYFKLHCISDKRKTYSS